ncbi:DEAD/DEAH box helicase family protein [Peribacillus sp. NPDC096622]|uniref:restriction endonuclease n=1 Tax=Peribacillus sp. NPDC096622 TaxID=3364396 RepID=UPI0038106931
MSKVAFQFDDSLHHQKKAIESVVELFRGLPRQLSGIYENTRRAKKIGEGDPVRNPEIIEGKRLLDNLRNVQLKNHLFADTEIVGNNFTIEMETGTGKTYVYLRTILELNREYGFTKFMIVVPSIPIRKGVEKSIDQLREHFKGLYNIDIKKHSFIYDSKNPKKVSTSLIETKELSICVMNIQAFNKDKNKIRQEDEYGQILWEDILRIRPIVIIDEPQKIEGTAKKPSASAKAIQEINPLFTLRYSATHKQLYNQLYKLDSYDAFKGDLVKRIEVKTVNAVISKDEPFIRYVQFTKELRARIEIFSQEQGGFIKFKKINVRGGDSLYELSGGLPQYRNVRIHADPHKLETLKIAYKSEIKELTQGQSTHEFTPNDAVRIQIRLAIQSHLDKQFAILDKGEKIKILSLFFIDSVSKVRDNKQQDGRGEYLRIFDEEYSNMIKYEKYEKKFQKYKGLFNKYDIVDQVREGYFAVDKNKKEVEVDGWDSSVNFDEIKLKAKPQEDVERGIDLILDKKDELISFNEPLSFIFSHSALREGWDNPNVFTICTLKSGGSDIAKKQEIGRGLRLAVDVNGKQHKEEAINELTIIANDTYDHFAEVLQKDFNEGSSFNKDEVTADVLIETLQSAGIPHEKVTAEFVNVFREELKIKGIISASNLLTKSADNIKDIDFTDETLKEHSQMILEQFTNHMRKKGSKKIPIKNGDNDAPENEQHSYVSEEDFNKILESLTEKLTKRSMYKVQIDKDKFINDCIVELSEYLKHINVSRDYIVTKGQNKYNDVKKMNLLKKDEYTFELGITEALEQKSEFEIVNHIMHHTMMPRLAIIKILRPLERKELLNSQDILDQVTRKIQEMLKDAKAKALREDGYYEVIDGYNLDSGKVFEVERIIDEELLKKEKAVYVTNAEQRKAINKFYRMDSEGEYDFAQKLESNQNVLLFTKLKKGGFIIDTPYGNYSPDWAVVYKLNDTEARLFFIVETKTDKAEKDLTEVERTKIKCGIEHFKAVSPEVTFDWVQDYNDFKRKFGVEDKF